MNQAVSQFASRGPKQAIELIGYSGALAVLIATRRTDVASIRTVAGNLDDAFVNRLHGVSSMPESENPIDFAGQQVAQIPQMHFSGGADTVVPPDVAQRFVNATGAQCAQTHVVPRISHESGWSRLWPALLLMSPVCASPPAAGG